MKKLYALLLPSLMFLTVGCNSIDSNELENYIVSQTEAETVKGDFVLRIVTEKEEYKVGEEIKLYGEIEYIGEHNEVTIHHSSSAILFPMTEKVRNYEIGISINEIGLSTTLKKGEPYREEFIKSGGYAEDDPYDYIRFMKDYLNRDDFPAGFYVVNGGASFSYESERYEMGEAVVEFKVIEE